MRYVLKTQTNMRIHITLGAIALIAGFVLQLSYGEFLIILVLIAVGLALEAVNTAIEIVIDSVHLGYDEQAKLAKDVASAAMLIFAIVAVFISCILFIPKVVALL